MFYGQCWKCGERWELGTASTCKCPEEPDMSNYRLDPPGLDPLYTFKQSSEPVFAFTDTKPNHNITFHNGEKQVGALDFNGPEMVFTGDADESAKVFFDFIAKSFKGRLEQERADEREVIAQSLDKQADLACDDIDRQWAQEMAAAVRARSNT